MAKKPPFFLSPEQQAANAQKAKAAAAARVSSRARAANHGNRPGLAIGTPQPQVLTRPTGEKITTPPPMKNPWAGAGAVKTLTKGVKPAKAKPVAKVAPATRAPKTTVLPQSHQAQPSAAQPVQSAAPATKSVAPVPRATAAVKPKPLPPTNDRPQRKQPRAVTSARPVRAPAPPPSAAQEVAGLLAPQYQVLTTQEKQREAALAQFSTAIINQLKGVPGQVQGDYSAAQNAINGYAQTAATGLANSNPNGSAQALMQAIGAPQAQQDQIAQQNADVFGGGAGVLYDRNGAIPASQTAADQAGALLYARSLPAIQGLASMQGMRQFQQQDAVARQQLAAQAPELIQKVQASRADNALKQAALNQNAQALGLKTTQQQFTNGVEIARLRQANRRQTASERAAAARQATSDANLRLRVAQTYGYDPTTGTKTLSQRKLEKAAVKAQQKNATLTPNERVSILQKADKLADDFYHGVTPRQQYDSSTGEFIPVPGTGKPPVHYGEAIRRLVVNGTPFEAAVEILNNYYHPGEGGRPWVAAPGRNALQKIGMPMKQWWAKPNPKQTQFLRDNHLISW